MAKLIILATLFVALVATASATTYTTTVTTTVIDNPTGTDECRQQIQPQQQLQHCMMYLASSPGTGSMRFAIMNVQEQHLNECCQQLTNIDKSCRCKAIQEIVREQQKQEQGRQMQREEMQQMMQEARRLPSRCSLDMPQQCQISVVHIH